MRKASLKDCEIADTRSTNEAPSPITLLLLFIDISIVNTTKTLSTPPSASSHLSGNRPPLRSKSLRTHCRIKAWPGVHD